MGTSCVGVCLVAIVYVSQCIYVIYYCIAILHICCMLYGALPCMSLY